MRAIFERRRRRRQRAIEPFVEGVDPAIERQVIRDEPAGRADRIQRVERAASTDLARDPAGQGVRQRLLHSHHLFHEPPVHLVAGQHGEHAIPAQKVVEQPAANQAEHVLEGRLLSGDHPLGNAHHPAELPIHVLVDLPRERKRQRRRDAAVAFDDVAVVPDGEAGVGVRHRAHRRDRARLQQEEPIGDRPLDVLRPAEMPSRGSGQRRDILNVRVGQRRLLRKRGRNVRRPHAARRRGVGHVHAMLGHDAPLDDPARAIDQPRVGVRLARDDRGAEARHGAHHGHAATPRNRIGAERHTGGARRDHALDQHRRGMRQQRQAMLAPVRENPIGESRLPDRTHLLRDVGRAAH